MGRASVAPEAELPLLRFAALATAYAYIASIPVEQSLFLGSASITRSTELLALGTTFVFALARGRLSIDGPILAITATYVIYASISYYWSLEPQATVEYMSRLVVAALSVFVVWQVLDRERGLSLALQALTLGGALGAVLSVLDTIPAHPGVARYSVGDPNDFGVMLAICLVAAVYHLISARKVLPRLFYAACAAAILVGIFRTASRTALLVTLLGVGISFLSRRAFRPAAIAGFLGIGLAAYWVVPRFTSVDALGRLSGAFTDVQSGDLNGRTQLWSLALKYWGQHPLTGLGGGAFRPYSAIDGGRLVAHSVYLGTLAELGLMGFALFLWIATQSLRQLRRLSDPIERRFLLAIFGVWIVGAATLTLEYRKITWLVLALGSYATMRGVAPPRKADAGMPDGSIRGYGGDRG